MIGRGRHNEILLFEVTEQDLMDSEAFTAAYAVGNVLLFDSGQSISIGLELARADDLACALEFLGDGGYYVDEGFGSEVAGGGGDGAAGGAEGGALDGVSQMAAALPDQHELARQIELLNQRIEQRDGLLTELNQSLTKQRDENELLQLLLDQAQAQLALDAASRDELLDDLQQASSATFAIESNLEQVMEEKFMLEQELAERITELFESSMANDDLRRRLNGGPADEAEIEAAFKPELAAASTLEPAGTATATPAAGPVGAPTADALIPIKDEAALDRQQDDEVRANQVLTMSSGKQIHIYHEFPSPAGNRAAARLSAIGRLLTRVALFAVAVAVLTLAGSVLATSWGNDISYGEALDLIVNKAYELVGAR